MGAIAGGAMTAFTGAFSLVGAAAGALMGMAYAAKNSPNCKDGSDYNKK